MNYLQNIKKDLKNTFARHWFAIALALLVGLITIGPNLLFTQSLGERYQGLHIMKADSEPYYVARIKEIYEGNGMSNTFIYEHKNDLPATPGFAAMPIAYVGMALGLQAQNVAFLSTFFLPFLIALLVYTLFFQITSSRLWSLAGMALIMCGGVLFNMLDILHLIRLEKFYTQFTIWTRPVLPAMSSFIFFLYLNVLLIAIKKNVLKWYLYLGAVFGLSFYIYFYSFTFLIVLNALLIVLFFIYKRKDISIKILLSSLLGFLIGLYPIIYLYKVARHPLYEFLSESLGLKSSRELIVSSGFIITSILFGTFLFYKRKINEKALILVSLLVSSFVVVNQQIITGRILQEGHYHWYFNVPVFSIIIIYVLSDILRNKPKLKYLAGISIITASLFASGFIQYSSYKYWKPKVVEEQRYMSALGWLRENTSDEEVVFANSSISELIPIFTNNNVVWDVQAYNFFWSKERSKFHQPYILVDFKNRIDEYKVDYVVWDSLNEPEWQMEKFDFLRKEYSDNKILVFTLLPH